VNCSGLSELSFLEIMDFLVLEGFPFSSLLASRMENVKSPLLHTNKWLIFDSWKETSKFLPKEAYQKKQRGQDALLLLKN
jgi:hypothetical protein